VVLFVWKINLRNIIKTYIGLGYVERVPDYWELFSTKYIKGSTPTFNDLDTEKTAV
jgi:iron complex outermembrane receptor protein